MDQHINVTLQIIQELKAIGFTHIRLELKNCNNPLQALVEVIPGKGKESGLGIMSLNSWEIPEYFEMPSVMTRYVIDPGYL